MKMDGEYLIELIGSCRNKVQVYWSVRMPQLHTLLHFHLTPIVMINGSSRRDLDFQDFCRSIPAGAENPSLSRLCYRRLWGSPGRGEHSSWGGLLTYMLSAVIRSALGYPAFTVGTITGTPEVHPSQSSRTRERSSQCSNAHTGYGPNCLTTF